MSELLEFGWSVLFVIGGIFGLLLFLAVCIGVFSVLVEVGENFAERLERGGWNG